MEHPIKTRLTKELKYFEINGGYKSTEYNRSEIFKIARYIYKNRSITWSQALKESWQESKETIIRNRIELDSIKERMLNLFTPTEYVHTTDYAIEQHYHIMDKASRKPDFVCGD